MSILTICFSILAAPPGFPRFLNVFSVIVAKKNDNVELECRTQGDPSPTVRWYKDSTPIDLTSTRFLVTGKTLYLFIDALNCRAGSLF